MNIFNIRQKAIANKIRNDPYYRFQSSKEIKIAAELGIKIDVNQASVDDWLRLPGISIYQGRSLVKLVRMGIPLLCMEDIAAALSLPVSRLMPLEPILQFRYYHRLSPESQEKVNVNTATVQELSSITIVNKDLAIQIVSDRERKGNYKDFIDIQQRLELDSNFIAKLMHEIDY